jgi:hypothetical protein
MSAESLILANGVQAEVMRPIRSTDSLGSTVTTYALRSVSWCWIQPSTQTREMREGADRNRTSYIAHFLPGVTVEADDRIVAYVGGKNRTFRITGRTQPGFIATGALARIRVDCYEEGP